MLRFRRQLFQLSPFPQLLFPSPLPNPYLASPFPPLVSPFPFPPSVFPFPSLLHVLFRPLLLLLVFRFRFRLLTSHLLAFRLSASLLWLFPLSGFRPLAFHLFRIFHPLAFHLFPIFLPPAFHLLPRVSESSNIPYPFAYRRILSSSPSHTFLAQIEGLAMEIFPFELPIPFH